MLKSHVNWNFVSTLWAIIQANKRINWTLTSYNEVGVADHQTKKIVPMIFVFEPELISDRRHPFLFHLQHVINRYFVIFKMSINQKILQNIYRCRVITNKKWMHLKAWFSSYRNVIKKNLSLKQNVKDLKNNEIFYPFNSYSSHHSATCENNIKTEIAFFQKD